MGLVGYNAVSGHVGNQRRFQNELSVSITRSLRGLHDNVLYKIIKSLNANSRSNYACIAVFVAI